MTDGGNDYLRRSDNHVPYKDLSLHEDSPFEVIRQEMTWGTYGQPPNPNNYKEVPLCKLSDNHIQNIIDDGYQGVYVDQMKKELLYRYDKGIVVKEGGY
jgi:hypothetical protein